MHRGERVCRSVLFWQKTGRRGSRGEVPRPIAVRHGTDAHRPNTGGHPSSAQHPLSPLGDQIPTDSPHRRPSTGGSPNAPSAATTLPSAAPSAIKHPPARSPHRRPPTTGQPSAAAHHRSNVSSAILPHRRPTTGGRPNAPPTARHSLGGPRCNQAPSSGEAPTCGHLPPTNPRQPPVTDTTPPLPLPQPPRQPLPSPRRPLRHFTKRQAKKKPLRREGPESSLNDNPQRGYLFSFRMRIACSRIVVSSNVTMPPSGPGSK